MSDAFKLLFRGLARHAPGSDADTRKALEKCDLPQNPNVWDLGAGTGSSTLILAEELDARIKAVDLSEESLETLADRAERRGLDNIRCIKGDFLDINAEPESIDLIWSEGAIYAVGWEEALEAWVPLLAPGGYLVATDCVWTDDDPPAEAAEYWASEYPDMTTADQLTATAERHGLEVVDTFELDRSGWEAYYGPLRQRVQLVEGSDAGEEMQAVAAQIAEEIRIFDAYGEAWNYVFFVMRK